MRLILFAMLLVGCGAPLPSSREQTETVFLDTPLHGEVIEVPPFAERAFFLKTIIEDAEQLFFSNYEGDFLYEIDIENGKQLLEPIPVSSDAVGLTIRNKDIPLRAGVGRLIFEGSR